MPIEAVTSGLRASSIQPSLSYQPGQNVRGQLVERLPGDLWRIKLGQAETTAKFQGAVPTGGTFHARVTATEPQLTLQMLSQGQGHPQPLGQAGIPSSAGLSDLSKMVDLLGPEAAARLFPTLALGDAATLTPQLTQWIEGFGHFFESRLTHILADLLEAHPLLSEAHFKSSRGLKQLFKIDLKPMLIRLKNRLAGQSDSSSQKLAGRIERWLEGYGPDETGGLSMPLPWPGGEARLSLKLPGSERHSHSSQITVELDSPAMGPVRIDFLHQPQTLTVRLAAEQSDTLEQFKKALPDLEQALAAQFNRLHLRIGEWGERIVIKPPKLDVRG